MFTNVQLVCSLSMKLVGKGIFRKKYIYVQSLYKCIPMRKHYLFFIRVFNFLVPTYIVVLFWKMQWQNIALERVRTAFPLIRPYNSDRMLCTIVHRCNSIKIYHLQCVPFVPIILQAGPFVLKMFLSRGCHERFYHNIATY